MAVVGATGAGKSTVAELVPRLMDADRGEILLDGVPVRELRLADLRRAIGFVPQETFLFSQTVGENVAMGTDDPLAVVAAARVAQLHEAVEAFPDAANIYEANIETLRSPACGGTSREIRQPADTRVLKNLMPRQRIVNQLYFSL